MAASVLRQLIAGPSYGSTRPGAADGSAGTRFRRSSPWEQFSLMSRIMNRRNAVLGWLAWKVGKRAARSQVRRRRTLFVVAVGSVMALVVGGASIAGRREPQL